MKSKAGVHAGLAAALLSVLPYLHQDHLVLFILVCVVILILVVSAILLIFHDSFSNGAWKWFVNLAMSIDVGFTAAGFGLAGTGVSLIRPGWLALGIILLVAGAVLLGIGAVKYRGTRKTVKCINCGFLARHDATPKHLQSEEPDNSLEKLKLMKDLGLLSPHELKTKQRDALYTGDLGDRFRSSYTLFCTRHVWTEWDLGEDGDEVDKNLLIELNNPRKCSLFIAYKPSYTPAEHKELHREDENQRTLIKGMIAVALISSTMSALITIIIGRI